MTTLADLVEATRRHLGAPETLNTIAAVDNSSTTVTLQRGLHRVAPGALLSVGLETMYVWAVKDKDNGVLEVRRGHAGSSPRTHAAGDLVRVAPDHTDNAVVDALNADLRALSGSGLLAVRQQTLTTSSSARTYGLTDDTVDVLEVRVDYAGEPNEWPLVQAWQVLRDMDTAEFPTGLALRLDTGVPANVAMRVTYKAELQPLTALSNDVEAVSGLRASAHDIPPLGAAWRLTAGTEVERNQTQRQGDSRRAEEVPPGAKMRSPLGLQQVHTTRVSQELAAQWRQWPPRRR